MIYINNNGIVPRARCVKGRHRSKSTTRDAKQFEASPTPKNNYKQHPNNVTDVATNHENIN